MKTYYAKPHDIEKERKWFVIDANGAVLGRMATKVASILRGKHKEIFTPGMDTGDYVIVINAEKINLTGAKADVKEYQHYSGYASGLKRIPYKKMQEDKPEYIIYSAVKGMLPHNKLGRQIIQKLKIYSGDNHPHKAQQPESVSI